MTTHPRRRTPPYPSAALVRGAADATATVARSAWTVTPRRVRTRARTELGPARSCGRALCPLSPGVACRSTPCPPSACTASTVARLHAVAALVVAAAAVAARVTAGVAHPRAVVDPPPLAATHRTARQCPRSQAHQLDGRPSSAPQARWLRHRASLRLARRRHLSPRNRRRHLRACCP